ncbi:solute carrier family 13 member 5-like isoform X2 [Penaeus japonicus]|uniref:solute carrier family 13 member 5-like isoform X2 n=1 Tax=Penaeus japonicus TaxID=27405 RepID=UPI001C7143D0|nr:solute carrier family 13 member 5-like isoform X2 [Penaeus japonicus]XP_042889591.1 solute carrier family 13 member 5-like isoform X2 [Penaeus japonicus]XP_042889592.1 solute carrier family 13 member 5-like isoform X2 [Penaeus japonicus]
MSFLKTVAPQWRALVVVLTPLLFGIFPILIPTSEARCGYVILVMAMYWMTEAVPLAVTALIPVFAFPLLGILSTGKVCLVYMKETNMMFLGGLTVAIAVEHCNLHKRIALFVILHIGQSPRRLMAGFMLTTMFLSMWISNTASTAMMVPIVDAILVELYSSRETDGERGEPKSDLSVSPQHQSQMELVTTNGKSGQNQEVRELGVIQEKDQLEEMHLRIEKEQELEQQEQKKQKEDQERNPVEDEAAVLLKAPREAERLQPIYNMSYLGLAYAANIGGTGVVTGTGPNLVLISTLKSSFSEPTGLNFATWMAFNVPGMLVCVLLAWLWLQFLFMGLCGRKSSIQQTTPEREAAVKRLIREKYRQLGPITHHEGTVLTLFIVLVFLWLFRAPEFVPGWSKWFSDAFGEHLEVDDATPAMFIVFLLFVLPAKLNFWCFRDPNAPPTASPACMSWDVVQKKIPWGVVLLLGGGFAMAEASKVSGLSIWLGDQLQYFNVMPKEAIVFIVCLMTAMLTEVASNTATASILLPVLKELALKINVNPLYLMLPAAVCCSYAFMLPVATPPNAIVFSAANMKSKDMMKAGFAMNVICVLVITVMINTLGVALFDLQNLPPWVNSTIPSGTE